ASASEDRQGRPATSRRFGLTSTSRSAPRLAFSSGRGLRSDAPTIASERGKRSGSRPPRCSAWTSATEAVIISPLMPALHEKRIEIRWRDMDAYGHVNNAVYLTYLEEVRDEWLDRALDGVGSAWDFVLARVAIDFRSELRQDDDVVVGSCR